MIILKGGTIIDGTANAPFKADLLVEKGTLKILEPHPTISSDIHVLDVSGLTVCPGFMDIHAHSELEALRNPLMSCKSLQGITFDLNGNCGAGVYPRKAEDKNHFEDILGSYDSWTWTDFSSYKEKLQPGINMGFLQSHGMLRHMAIEGNSNREASKKEILRMCALLETSLSQGCLGFSTGLYYAPCLFASENELEELLNVVKSNNALFSVHHRCEGTEVLNSLDEIIALALKAKVKTEISHLKVIGRKNQSKVPQMLSKIHQAKEMGLDIGFDQYPYDFGSTSLFSLLPPEFLKLPKEELLNALKSKSVRDQMKAQMLAPVGWDSITDLCPSEDIKLINLDSNPEYNSLNLEEAAKKHGKDVLETLFDLLAEEKDQALMTDVTQTEESLELIMKDSLMCFGTDALYSGSASHPRSRLAAIHLLSEYCLQKKVLSLEEAVAKMTGKVAKRLGLSDRGTIENSKKADLVIIDKRLLKEESPKGIVHVFVNGSLTVFNSLPTGQAEGEIICPSSARVFQENKNLSSLHS